MRRYRVARELRSSFRDGLDPRLRRCLRTSASVAALLLIAIWVVPARKHSERPVRQVPHERTARALVPPRPARPVPPPEPPQVASVTPKPEAPKPRTATPPPRREPAPQPPRGKPEAPPQGGGGSRPPAAPAPVAGKRGREAAAEVAANLSSTTSSVDQLLGSLQGTIPSSSSGKSAHGQGNAVGTLRSGLQGGRGGEALAGIDNLLQGSGAGSGGGPARGVAKGGVDVVDQGVQSAGEGSGASGRDSRSLMAVVERYKSGVKFCYDNALKKSPELAGKITLQMDIAPSGEVTQVQVVHDGLGDASLQRCIRTQVLSWRFPAIDSGTVRFTLPLVFSPPNG